MYDANGNEIVSDKLKMSTNKVEVTIPVLARQVLPVNVSFTNKPVGLTFSPDQITIDPQTIEVAGPQDVLANLANISLTPLDFANISPTKNVFDLGVTLPASCKNLSSIPVAKVTLDLSSLSTRKMVVNNFVVKNLAADKAASVYTKSLAVTVVGPDSEISKLTENSLVAQIDMSGKENFTGHTEMPVTISISNTTSSWVYGSYMYGELNRRALESLVKCGALDDLGFNRRQMLTSVASIMDHLDDDKKRNVAGQIGFFDTTSQTDEEEYVIADMPDLNQTDKLAMEKEVTGMYLCGHPMAQYVNMYDAIHASRTGDILDDAREQGGRFHDGDIVTLLGIIINVKMKVTKSNSTMAFVTLEDMYGSIEILVFPKTLAQYAEWIAEGKIVKIFGRVSMREDEDAKLVCETVSAAPSPNSTAKKNDPKAKSQRPGLYLKVPEEECEVYDRAKKYLAIFEGPTPLYVYFVSTKKLLRAPAAMRVSVNDVLIRELKRLLGAKNVAVVEELQQ